MPHTNNQAFHQGDPSNNLGYYYNNRVGGGVEEEEESHHCSRKRKEPSSSLPPPHHHQDQDGPLYDSDSIQPLFKCIKFDTAANPVQETLSSTSSHRSHQQYPLSSKVLSNSSDKTSSHCSSSSSSLSASQLVASKAVLVSFCISGNQQSNHHLIQSFPTDTLVKDLFSFINGKCKLMACTATAANPASFLIEQKEMVKEVEEISLIFNASDHILNLREHANESLYSLGLYPRIFLLVKVE